MMNLKSETLDVLYKHGYHAEDVKFVYVPFYRNCQQIDQFVTIDLFLKYADFEYDAGYGTAHVNLELQIVMNDGTYFEREEYDGLEGWMYHKPVQFTGKPENEILVSQAVREEGRLLYV